MTCVLLLKARYQLGKGKPGSRDQFVSDKCSLGFKWPWFDCLFQTDSKIDYSEVIQKTTFLLKDLNQKRLIRSFMNSNEIIYEIFGATIHPTVDVERKTTPQGYLFVCKTWNRDYISQFEKIMASRISFVKEKKDLAFADDKIVVYKTFRIILRYCSLYTNRATSRIYSVV